MKIHHLETIQNLDKKIFKNYEGCFEEYEKESWLLVIININPKL
jgi:hypothetical protein